MQMGYLSIQHSNTPVIQDDIIRCCQSGRTRCLCRHDSTNFGGGKAVSRHDAVFLRRLVAVDEQYPVDFAAEKTGFEQQRNDENDVGCFRLTAAFSVSA